MKTVILIVIAMIAAFLGYWFFLRPKPGATEEPKVGPIETKKHTASFNSGIDSLLNVYFVLKDAFVNGDSNTAKAAGMRLALMADSSTLAPLKSDAQGIYASALGLMSDVKANAESLVKQPNMTEMKQDFRMIGESMYPLLKTIHYGGKVLYWQNCPMAFGEDKGASWISSTSEIFNPYLGRNHPEFKGTMLHCGETKDSIMAQ